MSNDAAGFTGSIPQHYDQGLGPIIFVDYAADIAQRVADGNPARVLETAAGTGIVTRKLRDALPTNTHLTATDLNPPMLEIARGKFRTGEQVEFRPADAMALPFADASFDAAACQFGVMFFPDRIKGYSEARRVLKPGGRFVFNVWDKIEENDFPNTVHQTLQQVFPDNPPQFMARTPHGYHDAGRIRADVAAAGFSDIAIEVVAQRSRASSPKDPAIAFCQGTPMRGEIEARGTPGLEGATQQAAEALARRFGNGPIEGRIQALVVSAVA